MKRYLLALLLLPVLTRAQDIATNADKLLSAYAEQNKFSGNILIAKGGDIILEKSYGYADVDQKIPNNASTEFRVGSLTKMFTSALIMQLAAGNHLNLNDPVSKYVSGIQGGDNIQLQHLLSHTSGIKGQTPSNAKNLKEMVTGFKSEAPSFNAGSKFEYNNFNYILLSHIAEKVTGESLSTLIKKRVLAKAGMSNSGIDAENRNSSSRAKGYITNPANGQWEVAQSGDVAMASGAGAMYATTRDLYKWSKAVEAGKILPDTLMKKSWSPLQNNYGLGWMTTDVFGRKQIGHTGSIPGFIANFMKFPEEDLTIVLLSNYQDTDGRLLSRDLAAVAFGEQYALPVKKKEVKVAPEILAKYTGKYQLQNGFSIAVTSEGEKLFAQAQGDPMKIELTPESDTKFFLKGPETSIEFLDENGQVKYMFVDMQGGQKLSKVE